MASSEVPQAVLAALASRIGSVPGCHLRPGTWPWASKSMKPGRTGVRITVDGWSPSLHEIIMEWRLGLDLAAPVDAIIAEATTILGHKIAMQRERAAAGLALGSAFPLTRAMNTPRIEHMCIDATALGLALQRLPDPRSPARDVHTPFAHRLKELHASATSDGSPSLSYAGTTVTERKGQRTLHFGHWPIGPDGLAATAAGGRIEMAGRRITMPGTVLSDTILAALPGRPLHAITPLGPMFDMRRIETVTQRGPGLEIDLEPLDVALADIWDIERDQAVDTITHRIAGSAAAES